MVGNSDAKKVIVVGSGIAGTAAAFRLRQAGFDVTMLERSNYVGGRMSSLTETSEDGRSTYRVDRGAVWLSHNYKPMIKLLKDAGLAAGMLPCSNELGILRDGKIHRLSLVKPLDLLRTGLFGWRSKLKALRLMLDLGAARRRLHWEDMSAAAAIDVESAHDYSLRRLDQTLLDYLIDPLCNTQFLNKAADVSAVSILILLWGTFGAPSLTLDGGVGTLPATILGLPLMRSERMNVELNAQVTDVRPDGDGVQVTWERDGVRHVERGDSCVVAVPGPAAAGIVTSLTDDQREYLAGVQYATDVHVTFGLSAPPPGETSFGIAVPEHEHPELCMVLFEHNLRSGRENAGTGMTSLIFRHPWSTERIGLDDDKVIDDALIAFREALPELAAHVDKYREVAAVKRLEKAIVVRPSGGYQDLARFTESLDPNSPIQLAGDYFSYSTTNASLATGERAAHRIINRTGVEQGRRRHEHSVLG
ncbi:protoporphyrinogen/coproporphyrinogen oxidase [Kutzneria sp. NPDC052558]|uniref:protoporphyrinogen/coproporphyrinogen oxidase n=1 Tax=Kutzneria sp. NPDC052558 TaxID=3364121 RepID=UPI0037CAB6EA